MLTIYNDGEVDVGGNILSTSLSAYKPVGDINLYEVFQAVQKEARDHIVFWKDTYDYYEANFSIDSKNPILSKENNSLIQYLFKHNFNRDLQLIRHINVDYDVELVEEIEETYEVFKSTLFLTTVVTKESDYPWLEYGRRKFLA